MGSTHSPASPSGSPEGLSAVHHGLNLNSPWTRSSSNRSDLRTWSGVSEGHRGSVKKTRTRRTVLYNLSFPPIYAWGCHGSKWWNDTAWHGDLSENIWSAALMGFTLQNASMVWEKGHFKHFFSMGKRRNYSNAKKTLCVQGSFCCPLVVTVCCQGDRTADYIFYVVPGARGQNRLTVNE